MRFEETGDSSVHLFDDFLLEAGLLRYSHLFVNIPEK